MGIAMNQPKILHVKDILQKYAPTEEEEQRTLFLIIDELKFIWPDFEVVIHIPNSGAGPSRGMAGRMKAIGTKPGVSDIFYPVARDKYHGLWIELKSLRKGTNVTKTQAAWLKQMKQRGYQALVCYGHLQALEALVYYETGSKIRGDMIVRLPTYCSIYGKAFADKMIRLCKPKEENIAH